ncbi:hypothetical protein HY642_01820 [Candidatus Woesearchaeota archaeon]|nr:hypothetical protein [Candidatus Woesearchaeota archaeon]
MPKSNATLRSLADEVQRLRKEVAELRAVCMGRTVAHASLGGGHGELLGHAEHGRSSDERFRHEASRVEREKRIRDLAEHGHGSGAELVAHKHVRRRKQ